MKLFSLFSKKSPEFNQMDGRAKKEFLSSDLIERMIRVEQRVSASFGKPLHYRQTNYYKSLTSKEKIAFENHLKHKTKKELFFLFSFLFVLASFFTTNFTGHVISQKSVTQELLPLIILIILILIGVVILIEKFHRKKSNRRIHNLIEKSLKRKQSRNS